MPNAKIEEVEGIGAVTAEKFRGAGIGSAASLLAHCRTPQQRKELAEKTKIPEDQILKFANMADLFRIKGVGSEYSELLEAAGVDTVPELSRRNVANLTEAMQAANEKMKLTRRMPAQTEVARWVEEAKTLPRMLEY
ncbi:DUF4332 domain-containing protein [Aromatoleum buckelii]|uniref:DUF4332 domain-containing protein n=1 Tax=Aromatoleum buckelii TaxID=200254 RepID=A0ABX1N6M5_9RHOO|nr:DUF4332 domain-containing protein [Aromatoleum buckelii]MCK0511660.1 DUF4332 domain-containing protein [Aromatoleum buckelii]